MSKEKFFLGYPVEFKKLCLVYPPKLKDVVGESYSVYAKMLTISQEEIEDEYNEKGTLPDKVPTPMEYLLANSYHNKEFNAIAKRAFELFIHEPVNFLYEQKAILIGQLEKGMNIKSLRILKEEDYFDFQNLVREAVGDKRIEPPNPDEDPRVRRIKAKARYRDRIKMKKGMGINLLTVMASICCMEIGLSPLNIGELSYAATTVLIGMYQQKESYKLDTDSLLAGADSKKVKPKYWIRNLED